MQARAPALALLLAVMAIGFQLAVPAAAAGHGWWGGRWQPVACGDPEHLLAAAEARLSLAERLLARGVGGEAYEKAHGMLVDALALAEEAVREGNHSAAGEAAGLVEAARQVLAAAKPESRGERLLKSLLLSASKLIERALEMAEKGYRVVLKGVVAWRPSEDTLVLAGYRLGCMARILPLPILPWLVEPPLWGHGLKVYLVETANASIRANLTLGAEVVVIGKVVGVDPSTGLPIVEAEKILPALKPAAWIPAPPVLPRPS